MALCFCLECILRIEILRFCDGYNTLDHFGGQILIQWNEILSSIGALQSVNTVEGNFDISRNNVLPAFLDWTI